MVTDEAFDGLLRPVLDTVSSLFGSFSVQPVENVFRSKIVLDVLSELADF